MIPAENVKYLLTITIIKPENLTYRNMLLLVQGFRQQMNGRFPDRIEFTPALMKRFRHDVGGEGARENKFLNIPCVVVPTHPTSHNLFYLGLPDVKHS